MYTYMHACTSMQCTHCFIDVSGIGIPIMYESANTQNLVPSNSWFNYSNRIYNIMLLTCDFLYCIGYSVHIIFLQQSGLIASL